MTKLCVALTGKTVAENVALLRDNREWIDCAEVRADFLNRDERNAISDLPTAADVPLILTIRRADDGGKWEGTEEQRRELLGAGISGGYTFVDLEGNLQLEGLRRKAADNGVRVISSLHDFHGVPDGIMSTMGALKKNADDIPKIACMPQNTAEMFNLLDAAGGCRGEDFILIGMGSFGFPTRVLAPLFEMFLTFASPGGGAEDAAPGHITPREMVELYRFREISPGWDLFGIIADPVSHSKSPHIHNPALREQNVSAVYVPFRVDRVSDFISRAGSIRVKGVSVTIPHKESVIPFLNQTDGFVDEIGSCNTLVWEGEEIHGLNTDAPGFLRSLEPLLEGASISDLRVSVIGAGGTARAICAALTSSGCVPALFNRTAARAEKLASDFCIPWFPLNADASEKIREYNDVIIQTTSVGMSPRTEADPLPFYEFTGSERVYDVIYAPEETVFLRRARQAGCKGLNGWGMLLEQAYLQFKAFTGQEYPMGLAESLIYGA